MLERSTPVNKAWKHMPNFRAWFRLALVFSGLWITGFVAYTGLAWRYPDQVPSLCLRSIVEEVPIPFGVSYKTFYRMDWVVFYGTLCIGIAAIWLLMMGVPWALAGFRPRPAPNRASVYELKE
jgi:hypothetical protein